MKNIYVRSILAAIFVTFLGALIKINGNMGLGNIIMLVGISMKVIAMIIWMLKRRVNDVKN